METGTHIRESSASRTCHNNRAGIFQFAHRNDVALWFHIDGRLGAKLEEFVCKGILGHLADEAHKPGSYGLCVSVGCSGTDTAVSSWTLPVSSRTRTGA